MRKLLISLSIITILITSCVTLSVKPPTGCDNSILYHWAPYSFLVMDASRMAASQFLSAYEYSLAQKSAYALADTIATDPLATINTITQMPDWSRVLVTDFSLWFKPGELLNPCDRDLIVGYLRKW